ncbi:AAA family ATPase [Mailhella sp.]
MIKTLKLSNFTVFKEAELEFSPGLNVIVGENGTGKSHLLKLAYTILRTEATIAEKSSASDFTHDLDEQSRDVFGDSFKHCLRQGVRNFEITSSWGKSGVINITLTKVNEIAYIYNSKNYVYSKVSLPLFIPPKEILSIYAGFRAALKSRELAFDLTYLDLAEALDNAPYKGEKLAEVQPLYAPLEELVHAQVERDAVGNFVFSKQNATQQKVSTHAQMAAEGHRKLGMLSYLIKNGSLRKGSSLFWDEPEANMNPKLLVALARAITELSKIMQITIATHSLFLLRELEILQQEKALVGAKYFGLHFSDDGVTVTQGEDSNSIGDIAALDESINQASRYLCLNEEE